MTRIDVDGMTCAVCVGHVEKAISKIPGVERVAVNLTMGSAEYSGNVDANSVIMAVNASGYRASIPRDLNQRLMQEKEEALKALALGAPSLLIALIFMFHVMRGGEEYFHLLALGAVIILNGWRILFKGFKSLIHGTNMYTLVLIAFLAAITWSSLNPNDAMWEATYIVVAFVGFGDSLEMMARVNAASGFSDLASQRMKGEHEKGDQVLVPAGALVPVDGFIIEGEAMVEQALITGEPLPVSCKVGDKVWAGSTVLDSSIKIEASTSSGESRIDDVIRMVEKAQSEKADLERMVDRIAKVFVPLVIFFAIASAMLWKDPSMAARTAVSVLVIACPCAMGLATPISLFVSTSTGARHGILMKGHKAMEAASWIDVVVMDKTGTLTEGRPEVSTDSQDALKVAAALEVHTSHPIAAAILRACPNHPEATDVETIPGWGIKGMIDGIEHSVGKGEEGIEVRKEDELLGIIRLKDTIRTDAKSAIEHLPNVILSSGDHESEVTRVAKELQISDARSWQSPEDKLALVKSLTNVAMVGDGINDAAALAAADLGIAVASSSGLADISSDIVLTREGVMTCVDALDLAKRTRLNIKQNLFWAFAYNVVAIPIAMGLLYPINGFLLPPWAAAAAMSASSLTVVLNAIRLRWSFERSAGRRNHGIRTTPQ